MGKTKNLYKFCFDNQVHAFHFLSQVLEDNVGAWGYIDYFTVFIMGDIVITDNITLDGLETMNCFSELRSTICGK